MDIWLNILFWTLSVVKQMFFDGWTNIDKARTSFLAVIWLLWESQQAPRGQFVNR